EQAFQLFPVKMVFARLADARGNTSKQFIDKLAEVGLDVAVEEIRAHETDATIDVVADATGRNDPAFLWIRGANTTDAETIAPMNIGHGQAGMLNARQESDVGDLLQSLVLAKLFHQPFAAENDPIDVHTRPV